MEVRRQLKSCASRLLFGSTPYPELCNLGLPYPQTAIRVWLCGADTTCDVTCSHVITSTHPLTIAIAASETFQSPLTPGKRFSLALREAHDRNRLLGVVGLRTVDDVSVGSEHLYLFRTRSSNNYCLSKSLIFRRNLRLMYRQWIASKRMNSASIHMLASELRALFVLYICPRPVFLISVIEGSRGTIFPMDLVGTIGNEHLSLALHNTSMGLALIEGSRRIAVSSVPVEQVCNAYELGKNHNKSNVNWDALPFALAASAAFGLPVPKFSLRVRELEVKTTRREGSHTFFVCKIVKDQSWAEGLQFFQAHSFYEPWRQQALPVQPA
jgi:flavin reductase (DIM6/NTAB) family NADH-FMN oxidoreductase RutF